MRQYPSISEKHRSFIERQHMYFVGTAARDGRVNVSPKGLDSLRVLGPQRVLWLNGPGSGHETPAHILDSPRMTLMSCPFEDTPLIMRLYGTARAIHEGDTDWEEALAHSPPMSGVRNVFELQVDLV